MGKDTEEGPLDVSKLSLDTLKNPKLLIAGAIAALGGVMYAGDGFTIEFSTCVVEEAEPSLEIIKLEAPQEEPKEEPKEDPEELPEG
jgi:hypothetical protein